MRRRRIVRWTLLALLLVFLIRVFGCQMDKVSSFSMSSTILPKDRVIINKWKTGTRFPSTLFGLPGTDKGYLDIFRLPYFRLPRISKFQLNKVVAFNDPRFVDLPLDRKPLLLSRIVGLPGDTIIIWNKELYTNRVLMPAPEKVRRAYRVVTDRQPIPDSFIQSNHLEAPIKVDEIGIWDVFMDTITYQELNDLGIAKSIRATRMFGGESSTDFWPYSNYFDWNRDQVGPLLVPRKGDRVELNLKNLGLYQEIISVYEAKELTINFSEIRIDGIPVTDYTFEKDYYFVLDDNRDHPVDSRILGFIPEDHLLGTVKRLWWSVESPHFLKRILN